MMKIKGTESEQTVLIEMGQRIKQYRIGLGMTQAMLAERCRISSSTVTRVESGTDTLMSNYLKILYGLSLLSNIDVLVPEPLPNLKMIYENQKPKQRFKPSKKAPTGTWKWKEDE